MSKEKMKIGEISKPRFEFRTFGRDFSEAAYLMTRLSVPVPKRFGKEAQKKPISFPKPMM